MERAATDNADASIVKVVKEAKRTMMNADGTKCVEMTFWCWSWECEDDGYSKHSAPSSSFIHHDGKSTSQ